MNKKFKIAVVQAVGKALDCRANTALGLEYIQNAKKKGADLVLFPECWLQAYAMPQLSSDQTMEELMDSPSCDLSWEQIRSNPAYLEWDAAALYLDSPYIQSFCSAAKELEIGVVLTGFLKGRERNKNSAVVINKKGDLVMQYDKVHTCRFSMECLLESGSEFKVCEFDGVRLGIMICYDREYPESARVLMLKGAEIILVPNFCGGMKPRLAALQTRAYENMTGIVMANVPGENMGNSCAFTPAAWEENGQPANMELFLADDVSSGIYMAEYDLDKLREYREHEMMGNTFRNVAAYDCLIKDEVTEPFLRKEWISD